MSTAFPLFYIADAFGACFVPQTTGGAWAPGHLAVIALWGIASLVVASRRFHAERGELAGHATA